MKIVKKGNYNWNKPWIGQEMRCSNCGCVFVPEEDDEIETDYDNRETSRYFYCPTCRQPVYYNGPSGIVDR